MSHFEKAAQVKAMAETIINEYHPHLVDAKNLIGYYFREGGVDWAGKAKKCTAFERFTTGYMLFVFINKEAWDMFHYEKRLALVDHELCHFSRKSERVVDPETGEWVDDWAEADDPDSWSIRDHDVEEFSDVIKRHGLWETGIEKFAAAVREVDYQMNIEDVEREHLRAVK